MNCTVLGLDVETLLFYTSPSHSSDASPNAWNNNDINTISELIELAKRTPALLMYEPGVERAGASMAAWQLMERRRLEENVEIQVHNATSGHGYGYVLVRYVSVDVVPLIDYWPPFVRDGFAGGGWRFVSVVVVDDDHHEPIIGVEGGGEGWGGDQGKKGKGSEEKVVFEVLEFSLGVMEWLMEMEMETQRGRGLKSEDLGERKGIGGGKSEDSEERETERRVRGALARLRI